MTDGNSIFHVINNNDIVPRVPWKKQEVGRLIPAMLLSGSGTSGKYEVYHDNAGTVIFIGTRPSSLFL